MITRPEPNEYAEYYADYVRRAADTGKDIVKTLDVQNRYVHELFGKFNETEAATPRQEGEWTLKQVLGHLCDGERIFGYRALRISRGDTTPLAGFEQDLFVDQGRFNSRTVKDLLEEFDHLRRANVALFRTFSDEESKRMGTASDHPVSVRAVMFTIAGHAARHLELIRERFAVSG